MMTIKVLVTNASSRTAHTFLPMLCAGGVLGPERKIELVLFDFKPLAEKVVELKDELAECCYPSITSITATVNMSHAFKDVNVAILSELESDVIGFRSNAVLFRSYGIIINTHASKDIKVLVCGETANTSAFICSSFSPSIPPHNYTCLVQHLQQRIIFNMLQQHKYAAHGSSNNNNSYNNSFVGGENNLLVGGGNNCNDNSNSQQNITNSQQQQQQNRSLQQQQNRGLQQQQEPRVYCKLLDNFMKNNDSFFNNDNNNNNNNTEIENINNNINGTTNNNININNINNNINNDNNNILVWGNCLEPIISPYNINHSFKSVRKVAAGAMVTAKCIAEHLTFWLTNHHQQEYLNMGVVSRNTPYHIDNNIYFNMPVTKQPRYNNNNRCKNKSKNSNNNSNNNINDVGVDNDGVNSRIAYNASADDSSYGIYNTSVDQSYILSSAPAPLKNNHVTANALATIHTTNNALATNHKTNTIETSDLAQTSNIATLQPLKMEVGPQLHQLLTQASKQLCQQRDNAIIDCWRIVLPHSHL